MDGLVFDIYRGTTHDGPGIRDTVFLKGCSLKCAWCQNPESIDKAEKVWYNKNKCIECGMCADICPSGAVTVGENGIHFDYNTCIGCNACTKVCTSGGMSAIAKRLTTDDVLCRVLKDKHYFDISDGGVTLSGGEPLIQPEFSLELLSKLKTHGISTALDTCAVVSEKVFLSALELTDVLLLDLKLFDSKEHKRLTGADNRQILTNARSAALFVRKNPTHRLWVRTPIIPGATDSEDNITAIAEFIHTELIGEVERWELCMFNRAASSKYEALGVEWNYRHTPSVNIETREYLIKLASENTSCKIIASGVVQK